MSRSGKERLVMIHRIRAHMTYANVMATIAVFIALGGSSYAAMNLPRNSVGANEIRTGAVRSAEIKDRSIRTSDLTGRYQPPTWPPGAVIPRGRIRIT